MAKKINTNFTLEEIVFNTIHHADLSPNEIAANIGTSYNYLMRMANINDECNMPVSKAVPVMNVTKDYSILEYLAKQTGHLAIPIPRGIRKGTDPEMDLSQYSKEFSELWHAIMDHIKKPTESKKDTIDNLMRKHIGDSENIRRRVKKDKLHQCELDV